MHGYKKGQNCTNSVYMQTFSHVLKLVKLNKYWILTHSRFCKIKEKIPLITRNYKHRQAAVKLAAGTT